MKKLYLVLALLVGMVSGAWADFNPTTGKSYLLKTTSGSTDYYLDIVTGVYDSNKKVSDCASFSTTKRAVFFSSSNGKWAINTKSDNSGKYLANHTDGNKWCSQISSTALYWTVEGTDAFHFYQDGTTANKAGYLGGSAGNSNPLYVDQTSGSSTDIAWTLVPVIKVTYKYVTVAGGEAVSTTTTECLAEGDSYPTPSAPTDYKITDQSAAPTGTVTAAQAAAADQTVEIIVKAVVNCTITYNYTDGTTTVATKTKKVSSEENIPAPDMVFGYAITSFDETVGTKPTEATTVNVNVNSQLVNASYKLYHSYAGTSATTNYYLVVPTTSSDTNKATITSTESSASVVTFENGSTDGTWKIKSGSLYLSPATGSAWWNCVAKSSGCDWYIDVANDGLASLWQDGSTCSDTSYKGYVSPDSFSDGQGLYSNHASSISGKSRDAKDAANANTLLFTPVYAYPVYRVVCATENGGIVYNGETYNNGDYICMTSSSAITGYTSATVEGYEQDGDIALAATGITNDNTITVVYKQTTVTATMNITDAGWATFCAPFKVEIPTGVEAYTATMADAANSWVKLTKVEDTYIAEGTPVVLKGEKFAETKKFTDVPTVTETTVKKGCLTGNLDTKKVEVTKDAGNYLLQNGSEGLGWYKVSGEVTDNLYIGVNRCYMTLGQSAGARDFYGMSFDEATGINNVAAQAKTKADGKYLVNGKFVVVKAGKAYNANGVQY